MAIVTAILGILLYFLATRRPGVAAAVVAMAAFLGVGALTVGYFAGAKRPARAAMAFQISVLLPLTIGALGAAAVLGLTIYITAAKGEKPTPKAEAISSTIITVVAAIGERFGAMDRFQPGAIAKWTIYRRYHWRFPQLYGGDTKEYVQAYKAIHADALSDDKGQIKGWRYSATKRRLVLIANAL